MTNSNFNSDQPRGIPKNKGSWVAVENGDPEATLGTSGAAVSHEVALQSLDINVVEPQAKLHPMSPRKLVLSYRDGGTEVVEFGPSGNYPPRSGQTGGSSPGSSDSVPSRTRRSIQSASMSILPTLLRLLVSSRSSRNLHPRRRCRVSCSRALSSSRTTTAAPTPLMLKLTGSFAHRIGRTAVFSPSCSVSARSRTPRTTRSPRRSTSKTRRKPSGCSQCSTQLRSGQRRCSAR